jgi:hypothetical protein
MSSDNKNNSESEEEELSEKGVEIEFSPRIIEIERREVREQEIENMSSDSHESGAYKGMPTFDGKKDKFQKFKLKFKAYANAKGFKEALVATTADLPADPNNAELSDDQKKRVKANNDAVCAYTMALIGDEVFEIITNCVNEAYPDGVAHMIATELTNEYQPSDGASKLEYLNSLNEVKLAKDDNPACLFNKLSSIKMSFNTVTNPVDENDLIMTVVRVAPDCYSETIERTMEEKGNSLTLKHMKEAMNTKFRFLVARGKINESNNKNDGHETVLQAGDFRGKCFKCGQVGHKSNDPKCPMYNKGKKGKAKFKGKCNFCGMKGHKESDCFEKEENASRRPNGWKSKMEQQGAVTDHNEQLLLMAKESTKLMTFNPTVELLRDPNIWIADTGASCDSTFSISGLSNLVDDDGGKMKYANGSVSSAEKRGDLSGMIYNKHGQEVQSVLMKNVKYTPDQEYNLFSITKRFKDGWVLEGSDKVGMTLRKDNNTIVFDIVIPVGSGVMCCMYIKRGQTDMANATRASENKDKSKPKLKPSNEYCRQIPIKLAHDMFGHCDEARTRKMAKAQGFKVSRGTLGPCEACAIGKAKQRNVPKESEHVPAKQSNERLFLDLSTIKAKKSVKMTVTKPNWRIMVDERTQMKWSHFYRTKKGMVEPTCVIFDKWRQADKPVKYLRMDNAGENIRLVRRMNCAEWKLNIEPEFTAAYTPQQNHLAELSFYIIANRGRALMHRANVPLEMRYKIFKEALTTITMLDWLAVVEINGVTQTRYKHWTGGTKDPKFAKYLRTWGEAGTVKTRLMTTTKLENRGTTCMLVGYALNHDSGVYRMYNKETNRVIVSRDVIWLKRMFFENPQPVRDVIVGPTFTNEVWEGNDNEEIVDPSMNERLEHDNEEGSTNENIEDNDSGESEDESTNEQFEDNDSEESDDEAEQKQTTTTRSGRVSRTPIRLIEEITHLTHSERNYLAHLVLMQNTNVDTKNELTLMALMKDEEELVLVGVGSNFENTKELKVMRYKEAMATKDKDKWNKAVEEEHDRMIRTNGKRSPVWVVVKRCDLPPGAKVMTTVWAMKKKPNGDYRARINARGYEQIEGIHYDGFNIAAPVTNEFTVRIIFVIGLMADWLFDLLDVNGAFLLGLFGEEELMYIEVPQGFESKYKHLGDVVLQLKHTIYGTKQAAMAYWKEQNKAMKKMKYGRSSIDPCLNFKWTEKGLNVWFTWVDDNVSGGKPDDVKEAVKDMRSHFECDYLGPMKEYLGCKIDHDRKNGSMKITQPVMIQSFEDEFNINTDRKRITPAEPGSVLPPAAERNFVGQKDQKYYRSGVGKLLHMARWSRPEIQNAVRELSRSMKGAARPHIDAMHRTMEYCVSTQNRGWTLKPNRKWDGKSKDFKFKINGKADSDFGKCPVTSKSVSGYSAFLEGVPISGKSAMQKTVAVSVTESELDAGVSCAQDMLYTMRLLESMGLQVEKPMILEIDNKGAVDIANNWSAGGRTRHIKMNFLRDLKEEGIINVRWISGVSNEADLFTKNLAGPAFNKHGSNYYGEDEYYTW